MTDTTITNGTIKYGETRKIADFENKRADVELSFSIAEGAQPEGAIESVMHLALTKAHELLTGLHKPKPEHVVSNALKFKPGDVVQNTDGSKSVCVQPEEQPKATKVNSKRAPKMPTPDVEEMTLALKELRDDPAAILEESTPDIGNSLGGVASGVGTALTDVITDEQLKDATSTCQEKVKNPIAIRKLLGELGVKTPPGRLFDLAQDKRQAYLDGLLTIKPLA